MPDERDLNLPNDKWANRQGVVEAGGCCLFEGLGCLTSAVAILVAVAALLLFGCDDGESAFGGNRTSWDGPAVLVPPDPNPLQVVEFDGWAHCDWQDIRFLGVPGQVVPGVGGQRLYYEFVRTAASELRHTVGDFNPKATLPQDAERTEYTDGDRELWFSPAEGSQGAYIVDGDSVEWWPRFDGGCD